MSNENIFDLPNGYDIFSSNFIYTNQDHIPNIDPQIFDDYDQTYTPNDIETEQFQIPLQNNFLCNYPFETMGIPTLEQTDKTLKKIPSPQPTIAKKKSNRKIRKLRSLNFINVGSVVQSNKEKSTFSDQNIELYCIITKNHALTCESLNFPEGEKSYICSKNRIFWIDTKNKNIDKIHVSLETNENRPPCLFIDKFDKLNLTIEDFTKAAFTLVYQYSDEYLNKNYPNATFSMKTSKGAGITNEMAKTIHTLTIMGESEGRIISENKFDFRWTGKNYTSRKR